MPNRLLQAIKHDLDEMIHVARCWALGIVDKLVTGPFWRVIEGDEEYLSLYNQIKSMRETFLHWADDATPLLYNDNLFPEIDVPGFVHLSNNKIQCYFHAFQCYL